MRQIFFLTLPATLLLTAFFLELYVPVLWRRLRGHKHGGDQAETNGPRDDDSRSKTQAR